MAKRRDKMQANKLIFFQKNKELYKRGILLIPLLFVFWIWFNYLPTENILERQVFSYPISFFETNYYYLGINLFTLLFPFLLSFDKKVAFFKNWKPLSIAIFIVGTIFIIWDIFFTINGVWDFNPKYLSGIYFLHLPIEEWLFFFTVPYACVFIYECLKAYLPKVPFQKTQNFLFLFFILILFLQGILNINSVYYAGTSILTSAFLLYQFCFSDRELKSWLILTYIISWFPFMLVDGMLTGLFSIEPVVLYHPEEFSGIRILSVPLDDSIYSFLLIAMNIELFEILRKRL